MSDKPASLQPVHTDFSNPYVPEGAYQDGLTEAVTCLTGALTQKELLALVEEKLRLSDPNPDEHQYLQAAAELTICAHFAKFFPDQFIYEDAVNPPKDVDCSFQTQGYKFNIEVKCANFSKKHAIESATGFKLGSIGRGDGYDQLFEDLGIIFGSQGEILSKQPHMDNKLKDFLISADGKFAESPSARELNILIVCCDDQMDMQKWLGYLIGPAGLFTRDSYVDPALYSKVDLVVLTNLYHRHKDVALKNKLQNHWRLIDAFSLLCQNPLSAKESPLFIEFARTLPHHTNELRVHLGTGNQPDHIKSAIGIPDYVGHKLLAKGIYSFQPYAVAAPKT
ncbi:hypothetical protein [Pseudomonas viridiflava]|uniref:hypothetical protein n=1 Tax=Pseudomonas viridiflava TaxID=33069 RepID=UPI000F023659|nr:hypothetical protein [Pseudomonas viridiflava]